MTDITAGIVTNFDLIRSDMSTNSVRQSPRYHNSYLLTPVTRNEYPIVQIPNKLGRKHQTQGKIASIIMSGKWYARYEHEMSFFYSIIRSVYPGIPAIILAPGDKYVGFDTDVFQSTQEFQRLLTNIGIRLFHWCIVAHLKVPDHIKTAEDVESMSMDDLFDVLYTPAYREFIDEVVMLAHARLGQCYIPHGEKLLVHIILIYIKHGFHMEKQEYDVVVMQAGLGIPFVMPATIRCDIFNRDAIMKLIFEKMVRSILYSPGIDEFLHETEDIKRGDMIIQRPPACDDDANIMPRQIVNVPGSYTKHGGRTGRVIVTKILNVDEHSFLYDIVKDDGCGQEYVVLYECGVMSPEIMVKVSAMLSCGTVLPGKYV